MVSPPAQPTCSTNSRRSNRLSSDSSYSVRAASCEKSEVHEVLEHCLAHLGMSLHAIEEITS